MESISDNQIRVGNTECYLYFRKAILPWNDRRLLGIYVMGKGLFLMGLAYAEIIYFEVLKRKEEEEKGGMSVKIENALTL